MHVPRNTEPIMSVNLTQLSKTIAHALRHEPEAYGLQLDESGWVSLELLVNALRSKNWPQLEPDNIVQVAAATDKKRFEIKDGRIRAYYGHSTDEKIVKTPVVPPILLYHGTIAANMHSILQNGLLPMERQYVHLSEDVQTARIVGSRRKGEVIIFKVSALEAHNSGIAFYREENGTWLAEPVSPKFLSI